MIDNFHDYFYGYRSALLQSSAGFKTSVADHRRIWEAMIKKNPRLVERLARNHLERGKDLVLKEIEKGRIIP
jgi:DNA-binding GntR family transcriptional regulator